MREHRSRWTGCLTRFSLLTSLARLRKLQRLATAAGANSSKIITSTVRRNLARFRGPEGQLNRNVILATLDGPARGVRWRRYCEEIHSLGIDVRAGLHTGECEVMGDDVGGIAVHIGARVASLAGAGEVLVSRTVKELVAGSGLRFEDRGSQTLKGVPGDWRIYAVEH